MALRRTAATAEAFGLDCELISPERAAELYPIMDVSDLVGALWLPGDGRANPTDLTMALARGARMGGATIRERTRVTGIAVAGDARSRRPGRHRRADRRGRRRGRDRGQLRRPVGQAGRRDVRRHRAAALGRALLRGDRPDRRGPPDLPVLRDPDGYTYIKEEVGGLLVGGFEPDAKPWVAPDQLPYPFEFQLLDEDWDHFSDPDGERDRPDPGARETGMKKLYNGPESFTPDNQFILGAAPELDNFYVAAGFNSVGIASAGGAGKALADWIVDGDPGRDLSVVDIRRFAAFNGNNRWLRDRVGEVLGLHYATPWPNRELVTARPFRRSPAYHLLRAGRRVLRLEDGLGAGECLRPAWGAARSAARSSTPGASRTGCLVGRRAAGDPRGRGGVRPDVVLQVPGQRAAGAGRAAVAVHRRRGRAARAAPSTPGC